MLTASIVVSTNISHNTCQVLLLPLYTHLPNWSHSNPQVWCLLWTKLCSFKLICCSLNSPSVTLFRDICREVIKVKWGHEVGTLISRISVSIRREETENSFSLFLGTHRAKGHVRAQSISPGGRPQHKSNFLPSWSWTSWPSGTVRKQMSSVSSPRLFYSVMAALAD